MLLYGSALILHDGVLTSGGVADYCADCRRLLIAAACCRCLSLLVAVDAASSVAAYVYVYVYADFTTYRGVVDELF